MYIPLLKYNFRISVWLLVEFKIKVVRVGNSLRITIPIELVRAMALKAGDTVTLTAKRGYIAVRKHPDSAGDEL